MNLLTLRRQRTNRHLQSTNEIRIDAKAIRDNFKLLQTLQLTHHILPVLKSNAYGHGTQQIATILKDLKPSLICVDSYPEAQIVHKYARADVLIMGETIPTNYQYYNHSRLHVAVWSHQVLDALIQTRKPRKIHLFLDTGMHREGVQLDQLGSLLTKLRGSKIQVVGVISHFANADEIDHTFDQTQIEVFEQGLQMIKDAGHTPQYIHHNNSAGLATHQDGSFSASRAGLALLGHSPFAEGDARAEMYIGLQPALSVWSTVTAIQSLCTGESVSYGQHWTAETDTRIAVIPFGYYEGLTRSLRGQRQVRRHDQCFPVVGTICMNLCCIQIGDADVQLGDHIEVISATKNTPNSIEQFARLTGTISYEVLVNLGERMRRVVY